MPETRKKMRELVPLQMSVIRSLIFSTEESTHHLAIETTKSFAPSPFLLNAQNQLHRKSASALDPPSLAPHHYRPRAPPSSQHRALCKSPSLYGRGNGNSPPYQAYAPPASPAHTPSNRASTSYTPLRLPHPSTLAP